MKIAERAELLKKGYKGAFVVAYKGNKRIKLSEATEGTFTPTDKSADETKTPISAIDKNFVFFKIQIGAFINEPPAEVMEQLTKIPDLEKRKKSSGIIQYLAGKFQNFEKAKSFKEEVVNTYGITDAFMVAYFKDEMITIQEAIELLK